MTRSEVEAMEVSAWNAHVGAPWIDTLEVVADAYEELGDETRSIDLREKVRTLRRFIGE